MKIDRHAWTAVALLSGFGGLAGCGESGPTPQALLHLRTSFTADEVDAVQVRLLRGEAVRAEARVERAEGASDIGSVGLAPEEGADPSAPYTVELTALLGAQEVLTVRREGPGFSPREVRHHFACLARVCLADVECADHEVCSATGCVPRRWPAHNAPGEDWPACLTPDDEVPTDPPADLDPEVPAPPELLGLPGPGDQQVDAVLIEPSGGAVLGGGFRGGLRLGGADITSAAADGFVMATNPDGAERWSVWLGGDGEQRVRGLARGRDGRIWVAGDFTESLVVRVGGQEIAREAGDPSGDVFLLAVDADGAVGAPRTLAGPGRQLAGGIAAEDGQVVVVGLMDEDPVLDVGCAWTPPPDRTGAPGPDGFVWASELDDACAWVFALGGPGEQTLDAVAIEETSVIVAGGYRGAPWSIPGRLAPVVVPESVQADAFVAALDRFGHLKRVVTLGGPGDDRALALAAPPDWAQGPLFVTGTFADGDRVWRSDLSRRDLPTQGGRLLTLTLEGLDLEPGFALTSPSPAEGLVANVVRRRADGGAVLGLTFAGTLGLPDVPAVVSRDGTEDPLAVVLGPAGAVREVVHLRGPGTDRLHSLALAPGRGVLLGGQYGLSLEGPGGALPSATAQDGFAVRAPLQD